MAVPGVRGERADAGAGGGVCGMQQVAGGVAGGEQQDGQEEQQQQGDGRGEEEEGDGVVEGDLERDGEAGGWVGICPAGGVLHAGVCLVKIGG